VIPRPLAVQSEIREERTSQWLKENNIEYTYRPIKEQNPTSDELKQWLGKSGLTINKFFNTSGLLYKKMNMKEKVCRSA